MSRSGWAYMKGDALRRGDRCVARHDVGGSWRPPNPTLLARNAYIGMIETAQNVAIGMG
jgi:3-oxo-5,6-didehydrosuberyl-CoA/3-oxoadipyl-CoA thiolase